jgi:hypothetical protein
LLVITAALAGLAGCVVSSSIETWQTTERLTLVGILPGLAVMVVVAWGLVQGRAWAKPLAVALLCWFVVSGLVEVLADLTRGVITVPLGAIAAAILLWKRPTGFGRTPLAGMDRRVATVLVVAFVVSVVWSYAAAAVLGPSSRLLDG